MVMAAALIVAPIAATPKLACHPASVPSAESRGMILKPLIRFLNRFRARLALVR